MAVVGTLLSLLVFLSLFGTFLTFYLPLWMTDNEASFTGNLQTSLAGLQSNVELQAETGRPAILAQPFTMSSDSVPLLAVPTTATLTFLPNTPGTAVSLTIPNFLAAGKNYTTSLGGSLGSLAINVPNRYFPQQTFQVENGAVIESAGDTNQLVLYPPLFVLQKTGSSLGLNLMLTQFYGNATRLTSPGTIEVYSQLLGTTQTLQNSNGNPVSLTLNVTTHFPCAWSTFFTQTRANVNLSSSQMAISYSLGYVPCTPTNGLARTVSVSLTNVATVTLILASIQLSSGIGVV